MEGERGYLGVKKWCQLSGNNLWVEAFVAGLHRRKTFGSQAVVSFEFVRKVPLAKHTILCDQLLLSGVVCGHLRHRTSSMRFSFLPKSIMKDDRGSASSESIRPCPPSLQSESTK